MSGAQRLELLLEHADRKDITFDKNSTAFRYRGRVVPGLLQPLKRALWPSYQYDTANNRSSSRFAKRDRSLRRPSDGFRRGSRVHKQIELFTNFGAAAIKRKGRGLDEYTRKFLIALKAYKWRPIVSELSLYDPTINVATKADLLCLDQKDRVILVEAKTGYYASWQRACYRMSGPHSNPVSDSPCNQALMQLMFTKRMVEGYGVRVDRAYTVRVDPDGVFPQLLPQDLEDDVEALAAHVGEVERRRKRRR